MKLRSFRYVVTLILLSQHGEYVAGTATPGAVQATAPAKAEGGGNVVFQLVGYVKDSLVRTVDGSKEMWRSHKRCNEIRGKQREHREKIKQQWEFEEQGMTPKEMKRRLQSVNGGISYDEFVMLSKGKEDRGKLMNLMFLMWGAPRFFPYALMFYPDMLPSPFAPLQDPSARETKLEKLSRQRAHAAIQTLLTLEKDAKIVPALAKMNIFGRKSQQRALDKVEELGKSTAIVMRNPEARKPSGAQIVLDTLDHLIYKEEEDFTRGDKRLVNVPKSIVKGLSNAVEGPGNPLSGLMPNFFGRGKLITHIQKVEESDDFLVTQKVDLGSLSTARLLEACNDRLIAVPGRSDDELRQGLSNWLDVAVLRPTNRTQETGQFYNGNLARTVLMSYHCLESTQDHRSASSLPRLLFQGHFEEVTEEDKAFFRRRNR